MGTISDLSRIEKNPYLCIAISGLFSVQLEDTLALFLGHMKPFYMINDINSRFCIQFNIYLMQLFLKMEVYLYA